MSTGDMVCQICGSMTPHFHHPPTTFKHIPIQIEATARRIARLIADEANTCCHRGDGYREDIEQFAYEKILEALKGFGQ